MATYLTISEGSTPRTAKPILATSDDRAIRAAMSALVQRAGVITLAAPTRVETDEAERDGDE